MTVLETNVAQAPASSGLGTVVRSMHSVLPERVVSGEEVDSWIGESPGWTVRKTGVEFRHVASDSETVASMGAEVIRQLLEKEGLSFADIDAIVSASGSRDQFLPSTGALIAHHLGEPARGIPAFDIDATCLSFVLSLDLMNRALATGMYRRVVLVSAEMPTRGLDPADKETAALFGDAAVAAVLEAPGVTPTSGCQRNDDGPLISGIGPALFETFAEGAHYTEVKVGTSFNPTTPFHPYNPDDFRFKMQGSKVYQLAARELPGFLDRFLDQANMGLDDFEYIIPHQASKPAVELLARRLGIKAGDYARDYVRFGNTVAASIPLSLYRARTEGRIKRGDKVLLLGTAAGLTIGAMAVEV